VQACSNFTGGSTQHGNQKGKQQEEVFRTQVILEEVVQQEEHRPEVRFEEELSKEELRKKELSEKVLIKEELRSQVQQRSR
jgi:hypothetical protein